MMSVAMAFHFWSRADRTTALWSAGVYGLCVYGVGVSWVYVSMVNFGNMLPAMAIFAVLLFALALSLYFVVPVFIFSLLAPRVNERHRLTILLPVLWVSFEWLRGTLFTGFAWLYLGYTAVDTWFVGWATLAGVSAVSFVLAYVAGLLAHLFQARKATDLAVYVSSILTALLLVAVSWGLGTIRWSEQSGDELSVALVQANIALSEKWRPENRENLKQTYLFASRSIDKADLIVWPEAALPVILDQLPQAYLDELKGLNTNLVFGVMEREQQAQGAELFNSLVLLNKDAAVDDSLQTYRKQHLVPFGEFFPLQSILGWIFETFEIPMSNFTSGGSTQGNLAIGDIKMLPTICYEDAYPEDWRRQISDSHMILNISEDAWFGDSLAPHQRLQMARMRAMEFQRPVIRASNSGLSTVIDDRGRIDAISPQFEPALFRATVNPMQGDTPYTTYGQWPLWLWMGLCLVFMWFFRNRHEG